MLPQQLLDQLLADMLAGLEKGHESDARIVVPSLAYTGVATPVVSCEALQVYLIRLTEDTDPNSCGCGQIANISVTIARDCGFLSDDNGVDKPDLVSEFSEVMTLDSVVMFNVAKVYIDADWTIEFMITGGIGITSMTFTMPVPC